jgi:Fe-S-cluster-containing dehydrogenase component
MNKQGILVDYYYCTGCHACEIACQQENQYPAGQSGITVTQHILKTKDGMSIDYVPFLTDSCNLCRPRTAQGKKPACVKHCLAACLVFGTMDELVSEAAKLPKSVLYSR